MKQTPDGKYLRTARARRALLRRLIAIPLVLSLASGAAWAYWSATSTPGGNGASAATLVNQGATPAASATGSAVTVSWAASTLASGAAVGGYLVKRYDAATLAPQSVLSACTGMVAATTCVESSVPDGQWVYSVTPALGTNWQGAESLKSSPVTVGSVAPVAVANGYSVNEDAPLNVAVAGVLTNDTDANGDPLTAILVTGVANGTLTSFNSNGAFAYLPGPDFTGSDSFSYKANDGTRDSNVVTVTLTVTALNDAPVNSVPGAQQTPKNTNEVFSSANNSLVSISDADAGSTAQVQLTATNGTVTLPVLTGLTFTVGDGTSDTTMTFTGTIANLNLRLDGATFIPANNFTGAAALQIVTSDLGNTGTGGTQTDTDTITINVNSLGIFTAQQVIGTVADPVFTSTPTYVAPTYTVAGGGTDIWDNADHFQFVDRTLTGDGRLTARVVSQSNTSTAAKAGVMFRDALTAGSIHGMMDVMRSDGAEFHWRLTTNGFSGVTTKTTGVAAPYWVRITRVGNVVTGERSANGTTWVQQGASQTITMGSTIYAGLAVSAVNNNGLNTATFDNVALTTPPTAVGGSYTTNEDTTLNVAASGLLGNDTDPENDPLTAVLVSNTAGLTLNANGSFTYVPPANFSGAASFTYKANDGAFDSNTVTVTITVNSANEVPSFTKGTNQNVSQVAGAQTTAGWATAISQGTGESGQLVNFTTTNNNNALFSVQPTISPTGTLSYTPNPTAIGVATVSVSIRDNGGTANGADDTSAVQTFTITTTLDATGPSGGSVDAAGLAGTGNRYTPSTPLSLNLAKGTDPSGLASTGALLKRATATLTSAGIANGTCGTFGSYTLISGGTDPVSPKSDTVADQACYSYQYLVADTLGNTTTYTSPAIKVDLTAPAAPTLAFSAFANTYWNGAGSTVYYRSAATTGSFTTTGTATDTVSGIGSYTYPALGTNWTSTPGALGVNTYSWSGAPAVPGTKNVTASNNAASTSATAPFTPTADDTAPTAGTVSYLDGTTTGTTVNVTFTTGTDGGSGIGARLLQRATAPLTGSTCGTYGVFATVTGGTNATSPLATTVAPGNCYMYQYVVADNVGNQHTAGSAGVTKASLSYFATISGTAGLVNYWRLGEAVPASPLADSKGTNTGSYMNTPTLGVAGAIAGDSNTAAQFNGSNEYGTVARQISDNFSIEFWFKSTQGIGTDSRWTQGAGLVDANITGSNDDFGVSLRSDGNVVAGVGNPGGLGDISVVSSAAGYNNDAWHHVVFTRIRSTGVFTLYVDGAVAGSATGNTALLTDQANINFGRLATGANYYSGSLDEIATYNTVLSGATVTAHYNAGK